ncbi:DUF4105 domain-containing protein [Roseateles sp.]|uniref:Lnb N-terminal periplasmic domain-containing protein n=1 Tax=Roseateles sp. TaxID=1971397 RepID=UPI00391B42C0
MIERLRLRMQSGLRAAFALLCVVAVPAAATSLEAIAKDPAWAALLHVRHGKPMVIDPSFMLSLPRFSLEAELKATVVLIEGPDPLSVCRFPARYLWLRSQGAVAERSLEHCADLKEFDSRAPMDQVSLVFASETLSQPSSMMGHVFLKLSGTDKSGVEREHAISFFTEPVTWNLPRLFWRSLVAGMPGFFTLGPYEEQVQSYIGREERNLWEFPLQLDADQRQLLQAHLIELRPVQFTYYFQSYNCATLVKQLLAAVQPTVAAEADLWTTPKDVVRSAHRAGLLSPAKAVSAPRWTLHLLDQALTADDVAAVQQAVTTSNLPPAQADEVRGFLRQQAAQALNQQWVNSGQRSPDAGLNYLQKLRTLPPNERTLSSDPRLSPIAAPPDSQLSIGLRRHDGDDSLLVEFLPASHRLEDRNDMYFSESALRLFELALTQSLRGRGARVDRATVYAVESFLPRDRFTGGLSGRFKISHEQQAGDKMLGRSSLLVEAGLGLTKRFGRDVDVFAMANLGVGARGGAYLYAQPSIGFILRQVFDMKAVVTLNVLHNGLGDRQTHRELQWTQAKYLGPNWTVVGVYALRQQADRSQRHAEVRLKRVF